MSARGPVARYANRMNIGLPQVRIAPYEPYISVVSPALTWVHSVGALNSVKYSNANTYYEYKTGTPKQLERKELTEILSSIEFAFREMTPKLISLANGGNPFGDVTASISALNQDTTAGTTTGSLAVPADASGVIAETWMVMFTGATSGEIYGLETGNVHTFTALDSAMEPVDGNSKKYFSIPANFFSGTWAAKESYMFTTSPAYTGTSLYASPSVGGIGIGRTDPNPYVRVEAVEQFEDGSSMIYVLPRAQVTGNFERSFADGGESPPTLTVSALPADEEVEGGNAVWNNGADVSIGRLGRIIMID